MHLIQTLLGAFNGAPDRPGRVGALEYSMVAALVMVAAAICTRLVLGRLDLAFALLPF